jgi:N-carbamoyl-L-amino-acid hydrolase
MADVGVDAGRLKAAPASLSSRNVHCYLEVHIEQGPVLFDKGLPVGVVSGIRGNLRWPQASCAGELGHAGTVPRALRRDPVVALSEVIVALQSSWQAMEAAGHDLVMTCGRFSTDPKTHSVTTIPGRVDFAFEARSHSPATLDGVREALLAHVGRAQEKHGVRFSLGTPTRSAPAAMDERLRALLRVHCARLGLEPFEIASGAGHDAQDFIAAGIPSAMIFLRNEHGSHNPREHMAMEDFAAGVRLLAALAQSEAQ